MLSLYAALLVLVTAAGISAAPAESNAQRLARGLPPLKPRFGRNLPGVIQIWYPTPVFGAKRSEPSGNLQKTCNGHIEVRNSDGNTLGFVKDASGDIGGVNLTPDSNQDLQVTFEADSTGPFNIKATNPGFPDPPYVGTLSQISPNNFIATGSGNSASLTHVGSTAPNTSGSVVGDQYAQSAIWSYNSNTQELTAQYINPDGSKPPTIFAFNSKDNTLFVVGDLNAWNSQHSDTPASAVLLYFSE
jgi:hypothetical protein